MERVKEAVNSLMGKDNTPQELSSYSSSYYPVSQIYPYNPDELQQKKGGLDIYRLMMFDEQVKAAIKIKKCTIISSGYKIEAGSEEEQDKEIAKKIEYDLTDGMEGNFTIVLRDILSALVYGFSVTEIILQQYKTGEYAGMYGIKNLKTRPPHSFEFHIDKYNNLLKLRQNTNTGIVDFAGTQLKYFIIFSYDSEFGGRYGNSDLRSAYRPYWSKDITIRFLNIFNERFGMGIVMGTYPRGMGKAEQDDLMGMIKNIQAKSAFKIPEGVKIELLESTKQGQSAFIQTIDKYDRMISKAVLLPDLAGFNDTKGGAYNLGEGQINFYFNLIEEVRNELEEVFNEQLIPLLVDLNYSNITKYPKFKFNPITAKDKQKLTGLFITALEKGAVIATEDDEKYIRETLDFPARNEQSVALPVKAPITPSVVSQHQKAEFSDKNESQSGKTADKTYTLSRQPNKYEKKVNFTKIQKDLDGLEFEAGLEIGKLITKAKDELTSTIIRKKIVENKDFAEARKLDLKYLGDMRLSWKDWLRKVFMNGKKEARTEIDKKTYQIKVNWALPPKEALIYFEQLSFKITGLERDYILKNVQNILYDGLKSGKAQADILYKMEEFFSQYEVVQMTAGGELMPIEEIPGRLDTIIRTNFNDAYNQGRLAMFQDPDVADLVPAYQYSAILDDRTTEICDAANLDGRIYKSNNPIWARITPPNHFNCRSILVPITAGEKFEESEEPKIWPAEGFGA